MKTKVLLFTILLAGVFISCSDTDVPIDDGKRLTPLALMVDLNNDSVADFKLEYNTTITNGEAEEMIGYLFPLGATQILTDPTISQTFFLSFGDYVTSTAIAPEAYASTIISAIRKRNTEATWTVNSIPLYTIGNDSVPPVLIRVHMNPAYIGVKFMEGDDTHVGWAKIAFDETNGEPSLVAKSYDISGSGSCLIDQ